MLGQVDLWYAFTERINAAGARRELLSTDELRRHDRLIRQADRHRFLVSHALVRTVLSGYADVPPDAWRFARGGQGKPEIVEPRGFPLLRFNPSHTRGLCACAVASGHDVGVDVERTDRAAPLLAIARNMLSSIEVERLETLPPRERRRDFFAYWTLREAYVKALGTGMFRAPREALSFRLDGGGAPAIEAGPGGDDDPSSWRFFQVQPGPAHCCAVAVHGEWPEELALTVREVRSL
jgi:4'-phosphopantetheinyl transferase